MRIEPLPRGRNPFDQSDVERGADGVARYVGRPSSLVAMLRASLERGNRVALCLPNGIDWVLAFFGTQLLGTVVVPVNTRFTEQEVAYVVTDSGAAYTFAPDAPLPDGPPVSVEDLQPDELAAIFYTSGTTGFPKGAMTSHSNFLTNCENAFRCLATDRSEGPNISTLVSVPLFHVTGCNSQLIPTLERGGRVELLSGPLDFDGFLEAVGEHHVNQIVSVPAIYHAVIRHPRFAELDVSSVRWVSYGGAPIAESLVHQIKAAFPGAPVGNGFGLTETSSLTSYLLDEMMGEKVGAVIVPAAGQPVDVQAIIGHCRAHLADFKVPQYVALREQPLPRNPGGKVLKGELREHTHWGEGAALSHPPWSRRPAPAPHCEPLPSL
jgi:acyl-CoA synthetase (AMP-forming)/AMP-acid ligase II